MFFDCKADFIAYALLSSFEIIAEADRDAVEYALELVASYDTTTGKLRMTRDAHVLAQIYLAQLRVMASRHSYTHDGSLEDTTQARALLSVIIVPLLRHLSISEYNNVVASLDRAEVLLSYPLDELNQLVTSWRIQNISLLTNWTSLPLDGTDSYYFGVPTPVKGFQLEEILTPLPYPAKTFSPDRLSILLDRDEPSKTRFGADNIPSPLINAIDVSLPPHNALSYVALPPLAVGGRVVSWASSSSSETWVSVNKKDRQDYKYATPLQSNDCCAGPEQHSTYGQPRPSEDRYTPKTTSRNILRFMGSRVKALLTTR